MGKKSDGEKRPKTKITHLNVVFLHKVWDTTRTHKKHQNRACKSLKNNEKNNQIFVIFYCFANNFGVL